MCDNFACARARARAHTHVNAEHYVNMMISIIKAVTKAVIKVVRRCPIGCHKRCPIGCHKRCHIGCHKRCPIGCLKRCPIGCHKRFPRTKTTIINVEIKLVTKNSNVYPRCLPRTCFLEILCSSSARLLNSLTRPGQVSTRHISRFTRLASSGKLSFFFIAPMFVGACKGQQGRARRAEHVLFQSR
jgi:hypothetical protein